MRGTLIKTVLVSCMVGLFFTGTEALGWETEKTKLKRENESLKAEIEGIKQKLDTATNSLSGWKSACSTLIQENDRLKEEFGFEKLEQDVAISEQKKSKLWLGIVLCIIAGAVVGVLGWMGVSLLQKPKKLTSTEEKNACPRCGMSRTPGETVCRQCGTHF